MPNIPLPRTWFVPPAPDALHAFFSEAPLEVFKNGDVIQWEWETYDKLYWIEDGVLGQAVVNHSLTKPQAMNLYPKYTMPGFINLFSGQPSPRRLIAQRPGVKLRRIKKSDLLSQIRHDPDMLFQTATWGEIAAKSELIGMEALFTLSSEEKLGVFFASAVLACGTFDEKTKGWHLPLLVSRAALCTIIYVTDTTIDKLLADWRRRGVLMRSPDGGWWVSHAWLEPHVKWLKER